MSKYKLGDRLIYSGPENEYGLYTIGKIYTITQVFEEDDNYQMTDNCSGNHWWDDKEIDKNFNVVKSPVIEKTVKSIEPGVYGRIRVDYSNGRMSVGIDRSHLDTEYVKHGTMMYEFTTSDLESAAQTFMELAKFLREKE